MPRHSGWGIGARGLVRLESNGLYRLNGRRRGSRRPLYFVERVLVLSDQRFELKTWAEAEVTPGPVRLAMEEAERRKAEKEKKQAEGVEPKTEENKS